VKNIVACLFAICFTSSALSQIGNWRITEVLGRNKNVVGYIYHTEAIGTQVDTKTEKFVTGLRLACSLSHNNPLITIYWNTMSGNTTQYVQINTEKNLSSGPLLRWDQEDSLLIRTIYESADLIRLLKNSNSITLTWINNGPTRRTTTFDLRDFKSRLSEFNSLCKAQI
jgi:hypothetical protein